MTTGFWWLWAKTYLRGRSAPQWVNRDACHGPDDAWLYEANVVNAPAGLHKRDRSFNLRATPHVDFFERERRPLAIRILRDAGPAPQDRLGPCFLASMEMIELIERVAPDALQTADITQSHHGEAAPSTYRLCAVRTLFRAEEAFDRAASQWRFHFRTIKGEADSFASSRGYPAGSVAFRSDIVQDAAIFGIISNSGNEYTVAVSDAVAQVIMAANLYGVALGDCANERKPAPRYEREFLADWRDLIPAS